MYICTISERLRNKNYLLIESEIFRKLHSKNNHVSNKRE